MKNLENIFGSVEEHKPSLGDFTRKSVVGAIYRVGASFAVDAVYLTAVAAAGYYLADKYDAIGSTITAGSDFIHNFDPGKFARVAAAVIGINFVDYKFDVTNRLDNLVKKVEKIAIKPLERRKIKKAKEESERQKERLTREHQNLYLELKHREDRFTMMSENIKTIQQFQERCNWLLPATIIYIKTRSEHDMFAHSQHETEDNVVCEFKEEVANNYQELKDFFNKASTSYNFLEYFSEIDDSHKEKMGDRFSFRSFGSDSEGKLWIDQENFKNREEELYFIKRI